MKFITVAVALAAAVLPANAAPAELDSRGVSPVLLFHENQQRSTFLDATGPDLVKRASAPKSYLDRSALPDGCTYGLSGRDSGASKLWLEKQIKELKKNPSKVVKTLGGWGNTAILLETGSLGGGKPYSQVAYSWTTASAPAIKSRDLAAGLQKMIDSCGAYSPKGALQARYWLRDAPNTPSLFVGGSNNWTGNDGWCLNKRDEVPALQARASKSIVPGQCYAGDAKVAHVSDVQKCIKQLQNSSQNIKLPQYGKEDSLLDRQWFACSWTGTGGYFRARVLLNSTCKQKITAKQVGASVKRILNNCTKAKKNYVGGTEYLDGNDQVFVDVYTIPSN